MTHTILTTRGLSDEQRAAVEALAAQANAAEGTDLPPLSGSEDLQFLAYANDELIGFAGLVGSGLPEAWGMVHPHHRRMGIGGALLQAIRQTCQQAGLTECLLIVDEASPSGKGFLTATGAQPGFAEYRMEFQPGREDSLPPLSANLRVDQATGDDAETIIGITTAAFDQPEEAARHFVTTELARNDRRFYLATRDGEPIGSLRVAFLGPEAHITTFGVLPTTQGQGYGRQILAEVVRRLRAEGQGRVLLEVVTENRHALSVYHACGFNPTTTFGYYGMDLRTV